VNRRPLGLPGPSYPSRAVRPMLRLLGYAGTSAEEQLTGLEAQDAAIRAAAAARPGWQLLDVVREHASGADADRPVLAVQLARVRRGQADGLMVAKLDRLTRSLAQLGGLLDDARARGWVLVALDVAVDLSTPTGEMVGGVMGVAARFERHMIGVRTREALAVKRDQGVRLGRPRRCPDDVLARVVAYRAVGARLVDICDQLNADGVPTPAGSACWYPSHASRLLRTQDARQLAAQRK
jgi:DNA invertase Pin-like site-specific DNA recombinase